MKRGFLISGYFTESEVAELLETVRKIEQRHPDELYQITGTNREVDESVEDAAAYLSRVFPKIPGEEPFTGVIRKKP